jgi:hypothetical protein
MKNIVIAFYTIPIASSGLRDVTDYLGYRH